MIFFSVPVFGNVIVGPKYRAAFVGNSVQFHCYVEFVHSESMYWYFNSKDIYYMYLGHETYYEGKTKYSVARKKQNFTLTVKDLTLDDEGMYKCSNIIEEESAKLIVLGELHLITAEICVNC